MDGRSWGLYFIADFNIEAVRLPKVKPLLREIPFAAVVISTPLGLVSKLFCLFLILVTRQMSLLADFQI